MTKSMPTLKDCPDDLLVRRVDFAAESKRANQLRAWLENRGLRPSFAEIYEETRRRGLHAERR